MPRRHANKKFSFPSTGQTLEQKETLSKSLKEYKEALKITSKGFQEKKRIRQKGRVKIQEPKIPESGKLVGGLRAELAKVKKLKTK